MELCQAPLLPRIAVKFSNDNFTLNVINVSSMLIAIQKKKKKKENVSNYTVYYNRFYHNYNR